MTDDFLTLLDRSVEWVLGAGNDYSEEDSGEDILYIGLQTVNKIMNSDKHVFDHIRGNGYNVHYVADEEVMVAFDFSPYKAAVIGEQSSSGKIKDMVTNNGYPLPIVNLKGYMMRYDKWGWVQTDDGNPPADDNEYPGYIEDRGSSCGIGGRSLAILDDNHYITQDFDLGDTIAWSTMPCDYSKAGDFYAYGYDLTRNMSGAVALAKNTSANITDEKLVNIWAVPAVTMLGDSTSISGHRMVIMGTKCFGLADDENDLGGISFMTEDFLTLVQRSVEWVLGAVWIPKDAVLYVGAEGADAILPSDAHNIATLEGAGYTIYYSDDNDVDVADFDYSPFIAAVFGESCSSSRVVKFGTVAGYPLPCVMLEPLAVRDDKWGWVTDRETHFIEDRDGLAGWDTIEITDNLHYITNGYDVGEKLAWSTATTPAYVFGYDVESYIDEAVALAKHPVSTVTYDFMWALDTGTVINDTVTLDGRLVVLGLHAMGVADDDDGSAGFGTLYGTAAFDTLLVRSFKWIMGATWEPSAVNDYRSGVLNVILYPNPAGDHATLRFTLDRPEKVSVRILNLAGQTVKLIEAGVLPDGLNEVRINTSELPGSLHLYRLEVGSKTFIGKISIIR